MLTYHLQRKNNKEQTDKQYPYLINFKMKVCIKGQDLKITITGSSLELLADLRGFAIRRRPWCRVHLLIFTFEEFRGLTITGGDPYRVVDTKAAIKRLYRSCPAGKKYHYAAVMHILCILSKTIFTVFLSLRGSEDFITYASDSHVLDSLL
jgi:hypothetical protein